MEFNSNTMKLNTESGVPFLTYNSLSQIKTIRHAFSTRLGGVSENEFESLNLSFGRGDPDENVTENYKRFCRAAGFEYNTLTASAQDHNTNVRYVTQENVGVGIYKPRDMQSVDAIMTDKKGVTLVTYYADCTPLFFVDAENNAIALAHAGWRGTVGRIGERVVKKMQEQFNTNPSKLICAIGPAISKCCYEVDGDCADNFYKLSDLETDSFVFQKNDGKYMVDLLEANRQILLSAGVSAKSITVSDVCTKCNSDLLWSHRATNGKRGTMAAFLTLL